MLGARFDLDQLEFGHHPDRAFHFSNQIGLDVERRELQERRKNLLRNRRYLPFHEGSRVQYSSQFKNNYFAEM